MRSGTETPRGKCRSWFEKALIPHSLQIIKAQRLPHRDPSITRHEPQAAIQRLVRVLVSLQAQILDV